MLSIISKTHDPYFNLATEEYLLKNKKDHIFYLYRNAPSIIVGTNQNTLAEINYTYVKENDIPVVRRLSGGGAVFHDLGNLNFCFITEKNASSEESFREFTRPIIDVLQQLGVKAEFTGRNDLTIEGKKFSGNAQHFYKNKILHHGTLLFSSNMTNLSAALKVKPIKFKDKSVKSIKSRVTNISSHLPHEMTIDAFVDYIINYITGDQKHAFYTLSPEETEVIDTLVKEKYNTWDWTYGKSPKYAIFHSIRYTGGTIDYHIDVNKGAIKHIKLYGDFFNKKQVTDIEELLTGVNHEQQSIHEALKNVCLADYFLGIDTETFVNGLFNL